MTSQPPFTSRRSFSLLVLLLMLCAAAALYSNSYRHDFALDDGHSIVENPALRSWALAPSYFTDPYTFSVLKTNVDYRPVLQLSYALNYALGGYSMPVWHVTQVLIHVLCGWLVFLFSRRLLQENGGESERDVPVALLAGWLFLLHPANSGVVNYISARSSALTAAFLLSAFYLELGGRRALAVVAMLFALFTKVEAVAAVAVFWALSVLRNSAPWPRRLVGQAKQWTPYLAVTVFYIVVRQIVMRDIDFAGFAGQEGMTRWTYLLTQVTAWWAYLFNWICPTHLVADNASYPIFSRLLEPTVLLALVGWAMVALALWLAAKERPYFPFLAFAALALLSPTSSVVPLAEMMNEHRPYLPMALLGLIFAVGLVRFGDALPKSGKPLFVLLLVIWLSTLSMMTWQRNQVFENASTYWADVLKKAPSARAHNNFGLTLMEVGRLEQAREHFEQSIKLAPGYSIAHINLAITLVSAGDLEGARRHYDSAVLFDRGAGNAQIWRGRFFLDQRQYREALADFEAASLLSNDRYTVSVGLAQAYAGLHEPELSAQHAIAAAQIDFSRFGREIVKISAPYFESPKTAVDGLLFFDHLVAIWPEISWNHLNRATLLQQLGRESEAKEARETARSLSGGN